jgi:hypothetical protein
MAVTLVARNAKRLWWGLAESAFGSQFYICAFSRNLASVTIKMFSYLI